MLAHLLRCTPHPIPLNAAAHPSHQPHGKVIFSRSTDENGQTTTTAGPAAPKPGGQPVTAPVATDAERQAVTFTAFDMDVHLRPADQQIAVRALAHRPQRRQNPARPHSAANLLLAQLGAHPPRRPRRRLHRRHAQLRRRPHRPASRGRRPARRSRSRPAQPSSSTSPTPASSRPPRSA